MKYVSARFRILFATALVATTAMVPAPFATTTHAARTESVRLQPVEDYGYLMRATEDGAGCQDATPEEAAALTAGESREDMVFLPRLNEGKTTAGLVIQLRATRQLEKKKKARTAFMRAAARWESIVQSPITIIIDVDFGKTRFGVRYPTNVIGSTSSQTLLDDDYNEVREALVAGAGPNETALYAALPENEVPTDQGAGATNIVAPSAVFRGLGLLPPVANPTTEGLGNPPAIGFNSAFNFDFKASDGVAPGMIDFEAVVVHEIGHALGFGSNSGARELGSSQIALSVWDLFRFRPGVTFEGFGSTERIQTSGGDHIYFDGVRVAGLSTGRPNGQGGDGRQASHWEDDAIGGTYLGIMDPTIPSGVRFEITELDRRALDAFGYSVAP